MADQAFRIDLADASQDAFLNRRQFVKSGFEDAFVDEAQVRRLFERHGLQVLGVKYGSWRGPRYAFRGHAGHQDLFVVKKP